MTTAPDASPSPPRTAFGGTPPRLGVGILITGTATCLARERLTLAQPLSVGDVVWPSLVGCGSRGEVQPVRVKDEQSS